ncbi:transporter substrate-binding domain-containing protein [Clostridium butyricum]|uniref:transporter substrate-binding domain-containing protein n=1 Tax=Clostridium butyricum TaxID=1492 RepID=UPI003D09808F
MNKNGKLTIGTSADYPPYEFHKEIDRKDTIVGLDIKIAEEIASDLGVELEIKDMDCDGLLVALQSDKIDMAFAAMNPTEERKQNTFF